jgi:hypothetical protein
MSRLALDELEARCDQLQRRMATSASSDSRRASPVRSGRSTPTLTTVAMSNALPANGGGGASHILPPQPHEIAFAVQQLEKEKQRLEEQLRAVNTHLQTYRYLMKMPSPLPSAAALDNATAATALGGRAGSNSNNSGGVTFMRSPQRSERTLHSPAYNATTGAGAGGNSAAVAAAMTMTPALGTALSFTPAGAAGASTVRGGGGGGGGDPNASSSSIVPSAMGNDQIADELRRIRRAREEREAQRRLSAAIQTGANSPSNF